MLLSCTLKIKIPVSLIPTIRLRDVNRRNMTEKKKAVIIGAGVGGLATANYLAKMATVLRFTKKMQIREVVADNLYTTDIVSTWEQPFF